jgi:flagellar motor switch protein FliM
MEKLSNQTWAQYKRNRQDVQLRHQLSKQLDVARLTASTILAETTIKLSDLMNLQPGDLIVTEKPSSGPLTLCIEGKRKYIGHIGQHKGNRAFKVKRKYHPKDRV